MDWENPKTKFVVKALPLLCIFVFAASLPYASWLYAHRPHMPEGAFTAKPIFGQTMYLLPWECSLLTAMVLGSWVCGAVSVLMVKGLYPDEAMGCVWRGLFGTAFILAILSAIVLGQMK